MPVSSLPNRRDFAFDKSMELRDGKLAPVNADGFELGIPLVASAFNALRCIIYSDSYTGYSTGAAQWTATVEASTAMGGTYRAVGSAVIDGSSADITEIPLTGNAIEQVVPNARFVRIRVAKLGAVGALTYGAFLSK